MSAKTLHRETTDCDHYDGVDGQKIGLGGVITVVNAEGNKMDVTEDMGMSDHGEGMQVVEDMEVEEIELSSVEFWQMLVPCVQFFDWVKTDFLLEPFLGVDGMIGFQSLDDEDAGSVMTHDNMRSWVQCTMNPNMEILGWDWCSVQKELLAVRILHHMYYEYGQATQSF
jgi:hypothetical protein